MPVNRHIPLTVHCKYMIQVQISRLIDLHAQLRRIACALVTPSGENIEYTKSSHSRESKINKVCGRSLVWTCSRSVCVCVSGPALSDRRAPLPQFWGLFHGAGPHHRPGGQSLPRSVIAVVAACCSQCVRIPPDVFSPVGGHLQREPAAWRLGVRHVVQPSDWWTQGEPPLLWFLWLAVMICTCERISVFSTTFLVLRTWRSSVTRLGPPGASSPRSSAGNFPPSLVTASTGSSWACWEKNSSVCILFNYFRPPSVSCVGRQLILMLHFISMAFKIVILDKIIRFMLSGLHMNSYCSVTLIKK